MHEPKASALRHRDRYYIILVRARTLKHLIPAKCAINITYIRKYGSTFYIGIAMVVLPYFGPWEN